MGSEKGGKKEERETNFNGYIRTQAGFAIANSTAYWTSLSNKILHHIRIPMQQTQIIFTITKTITATRNRSSCIL